MVDSLKKIVCRFLCQRSLTLVGLTLDLIQELSLYRKCQVCSRIDNSPCHIIKHFDISETYHNPKGYCRLCDGAPDNYACEAWGGPSEDKCFRCGRGWYDDEILTNCQKCKPAVLYCQKCLPIHSIM